MILVDTSVWVDHLGKGDPDLVRFLDAGEVLVHPFVVGELALGNLRHRRLVLGGLARMPRAEVATDAEVLGFIDSGGLFGRGIGYVDAHLLASARLAPGTSIWTRDKRLLRVARDLRLAAASH